jgi:uncharacterized membrane protein YdbT with pleckstrin-like domain
MGYIEQNLTTGETVIYRARLHWVIFLWPAACLLVALLLFLSRDSGNHAIGGFFLIVGLIWGLLSYIKFGSSEFGVTNRSVLIKVGFIQRRSLELLLQKVEGMGINQSIPGRVFGYGTIIVTGTGGTKEFFHNIAAPLEFRRMVQQQASSS